MAVLYEVGVFAFCAFYFLNASQIPFGTLKEPGAGFFPLILAYVGLVVSMSLLASALHRRITARGGTRREESRRPGRPIVPLDMVAFGAVVVVFSLLFEVVGVVLGIFALTVALGKVCGLEGWPRPLGIGAATSASIYVVFVLIFRIPMPVWPAGLS